ncbi:glycosyltransferase family 4 protein [Candidatus Woesearchaeota archaeon]|nr:glycosyltransferase family 4 protein [Candidatus Woesearchaeota archaeon]
MKKLRVAVVIPTQPDIKSSLQNLLKVYEYLIKKYRIEVTIFTDAKNNFSYKNFKVEKINSLDYRTVIEKIFLLLGFPRFYYFDLIGKLKGYDAIESSNPEFYWFAYQSYLAAKKYKIRLIYRTSQTIEGFFLFKYTKPIALYFAEKACNYARYLLFANPEAEKRCINLGLLQKGSKKSVVIGHPTDVHCFKPMNVKKNSRPVVLSVGALYKLKGHDMIIRAAKEIIDRGYDIELWIVGEGYYKDELVQLSEGLGIGDKIKFLGAKSHAELAVIYNMSSVFVLANTQEITPAVNEALACRIPVLVMDCGGVEFAVKNKEYGIVTKKFDVNDMANGIKMLLDNKKYAEKLADKGRRYILNNFTIGKVAEKFYRCFIQ